MKIRNTEHRDRIVLQMTPMIDIVFQLLVFFVFTFKIVLPRETSTFACLRPRRAKRASPAKRRCCK